MSKNIHRGFIATLAAGALTLSLAPMASANGHDGPQIDNDGPGVDVNIPEETAFSAEVFRIADSTRILTAIEASQSRTDWGDGLVFNSNVRWVCEAPSSFQGTVVQPPYTLGDKLLTVDGLIQGTVGGTVGGDLGGFLNGNVDGTIGGNLNGTVLGDIFGDIFGDIEGDITGDITGDIVGDLLEGLFEADLTGDLELDGDILFPNFDQFLQGIAFILDADGTVVGTVDGDITAELVAALENAVLDASIVDGKIVGGGIDAFIDSILAGTFDGIFTGTFGGDFDGLFTGTFDGTLDGTLDGVAVACEAVELGDFSGEDRAMDIIVARSDDYPDALAAGPLADIVNAPILLNPSNALDPAVAAEITRLANLKGDRYTTVHLLGGTDALSAAVEGALLPGLGVDNVIRHQGIDRYETATAIAEATVNEMFLSDANLDEVNAYLTTGINFPDALAAGAAAANNDGVVLLTNGTQLDRRGFTEAFLVNLRNLIVNGGNNTPEIFAVGGPSAAAAETFDIRLAPNGAYVGADRYETATLTAAATFGTDLTGDFAVVSGEAFPDALVAGGWIANLDGPLLLTRADALTPVTATYLNTYVLNGDRIFTFGGPDSLKAAVTEEIRVLLEAKFAIDPEVR